MKKMKMSENQKLQLAVTWMKDEIERERIRADKAEDQLAQAPHGFSCATIQWKTRECTCWKAGI